MNLALIIAIVALYSFGHWIGATVLLIVLALVVIEDHMDHAGLRRLRDRYRF